ncbi:acyl-CoA thioesterase [Streptomyces sp. NPDC017940]|uniref:acyl-CoA thioesterase n=1 Tax=Streptomyces sp. NPDC017940 TaxID=3365017 RepID=UPI0037A7BE0F
MAVFTHQVTMRWSDVNAYGVASDTAIASYVEETRAALIRKVVTATTVRESADYFAYLTVRQRIDYLMPVRWQEQPLELDLRVLLIRPAATELCVRLASEGHPVAEARILSTCWDTARNRPRLLNNEQREFLSQYLVPESRTSAAAPDSLERAR